MTPTLSIPQGIAQSLLSHGGTIVFRLLTADEFVTYCKKRDFNIDRKRLITLEKLGLFAPFFRVNNANLTHPIPIPLPDDNAYFENGALIDTMSNRGEYPVPSLKDDHSQAYYSIFQLDELNITLTSMNLTVQLDSYLEPLQHNGDMPKINTESWIDYATQVADSMRTSQHREGIGLLCQYISDRYGPHSKSNQRTMSVPEGPVLNTSNFVSTVELDWNWYELAKSWDPHKAEALFSLTPEKLKHAYETLSSSQAHCDPLDNWYQLTQFVSYNERQKLKGLALRAESLRSGCIMLQKLYADLYGEDLPHPNEIHRTVINHFPELHIRNDTRKYLEFVVNRYALNPQPKVTLFVEGQSEEKAIEIIFESYFGAHPGKYGIEIVCLKGVDNATGSKEDRFRAILRLVDYLHMHQTFTFLILDNENYAAKLKQNARRAKSIHGDRRHVTRAEYIKVWRDSFELDNFSATEIAKAMNSLANQDLFKTKAIIECKILENPTNALSKLYKSTTGYGLNKIKLTEELVELMLSKNSRRNPENRPITKVLRRVIKLAVRNPFPSRHKTWEKNQLSKFLGKIGD
ncbi:hypothetical protein [uncultured Pseudodesulfovibrio sp.]|uniref:hypothetical protein n=1 Tax=uncultured Pseudodesulfovibrio sp. TaxID=2035858 RepID=UPI0029C6532B|nr:hypothetical protein [uncultured Pseudodesulfovibrio sp.]